MMEVFIKSYSKIFLKGGGGAKGGSKKSMSSTQLPTSLVSSLLPFNESPRRRQIALHNKRQRF